MGIAADPQETVTVTLAADAARPNVGRPTFIYRHLTSRQASARRRLLGEAMKESDDEKRFALEADLILMNLVGWHGLTDFDGAEIPFDPQQKMRIHDALTEAEVWEIIAGVPAAMRLAADAKKKSASSPATGSATSAPTAPNPASA